MAALARVLVISFSDLALDPRVDRQIVALRTRHHVLAAGLAAPAHDGVEFVDLTTPPLGKLDGVLGVARLVGRRFASAYWRHPKNQELLRRLERIEADVVIVNDITALPIALRLGSPVVFDAHEYAPEEFSHQLWWRTLIAPYVDWICREALPKVSAMTTVSEGIARAYEHAYGVTSTVVMSAPPYAELGPTPVHTPIRILYHGIAHPGRGLDEMLSLADLLDERFTLDFVLTGRQSRYRDGFVARARNKPMVQLSPPVPMREIPQMANGYDIGLFLLPPNNANHLHTLPNKFFEFIQARLAVAIGPSPEMAGILRRYGCGVVASDFTPEALAAELNSVDSTQIAAMKQASDAAAADLCAERNAEAIFGAVDTALASLRSGVCAGPDIA